MLFLEIIKSVILGIVEGVTEWLPISSTGHMILVDELIQLNTSKAFKEMFLVVIQLGAILAVVLMYFHKLNPFSPKKNKLQKRETWEMWLKVLVASLPAGIIGIAFDDTIDAMLTGALNVVIVALALIVYGVLYIFLENRCREPKIQTVDAVNYKNALLMGVFQTLALVPGTSRSGSTILGGIILGASRTVAAEFSFFMSIPAMFGGSAIKALKFFMDGHSVSGAELAILLVGTLVSFLVSVAAIKFLMSYIRKHDFKAFGYYRIVLGLVVLVYFILKYARP
ncbi:MAG: undecaprenyl-diphosphate phosphatase [Clostridia bacterium]|nr:undecaprenyl-diphosphate phosphatase [Clostridia bacterium]